MKLSPAHMPSNLRHSLSASGEKTVVRLPVVSETVAPVYPWHQAHGASQTKRSGPQAKSSLLAEALTNRYLTRHVARSASRNQLTFDEIRYFPTDSTVTLQHFLQYGSAIELAAVSPLARSEKQDIYLKQLFAPTLHGNAQTMNVDAQAAQYHVEGLEAAATESLQAIMDGYKELRSLGSSNKQVHEMRSELAELIRDLLDVREEEKLNLFQDLPRLVRLIDVADNFMAKIIVVPRDKMPIPRLILADVQRFDFMIHTIVHREVGFELEQSRASMAARIENRRESC